MLFTLMGSLYECTTVREHFTPIGILRFCFFTKILDYFYNNELWILTLMMLWNWI